VLGQSGSEVRSLVAAARRQGIEVTLSERGGRQVVSGLRYVFHESHDLEPSPFRTRKGLGRGSFCLGVVPAYGRPDGREETTGDGGKKMLLLEYLSAGSRTTFVCRGGRLVEIVLVLEDTSPG
jgi:hypothetical protein